jgi:triphosphatase
LSEEHELKYAVDDLAAMEAWLDREWPTSLHSSGWHDVAVSDRYFDTADEALAAAGYGARLRGSGDGTLLALKAIGTAGGALHSRRELEAPATPALSPDEWPPSEARELVRRIAGDRPLVDRFVLEQRRRERHIAMDDARLTLSLDRVAVRAEGRHLATLTGLEIELLTGRPETLVAIAERLEPSGLAAPESRTKMEIAADLTGR